MIRFVKPEEWGKVEGVIADMPWISAKERFVAFFKDPRRGSGFYEHVEKNHGCYASSATAWAVAMNSVITILNTIPDDASEAEVIAAFGL